MRLGLALTSCRSVSRRPRPFSRDLPTPASALAIAAHPDDVEFDAGGHPGQVGRGGCMVHHLI